MPSQAVVSILGDRSGEPAVAPLLPRICYCERKNISSTEGAKVVSHGRYVTFQMAEVAIPRQVFQEILRLITELRPQPPPALNAN
jgi:hypothetical protein